jgi:hypothetical protein
MSFQQFARSATKLRSVARGLGAIAGLIPLAGVGVCFAASPYNPDHLPADQTARIGEICRAVMGLEAAEAHYQACLDSLMASARSLDDAQAVLQARAGCLKQGLAANSATLAECELQPAAVRPVDVASVGRDSAGAAAEAGAAKSYSYASPREVFHREQRSCARLGFDPIAEGFGACVASLQSAMFEADNPAH